MIRNLFLTLTLMACLTLNAQQNDVLPGDPAFTAKYADVDFKGNFTLAVGKDASNNYYLVDFSKFASRFERVYFMNLSFSYDELISIDADITKNRVCFKAGLKYAGPEVIKIFDEIKNKVTITAAAWSDDREHQWLNANDKYK